jgi:hypothetical protein
MRGPQDCAPEQITNRYAFWPEAPDAPHIQFLTAFNSSKDLNEKKSGGLAEAIYGSEPEGDLFDQQALRRSNVERPHLRLRRPHRGVTVFDLRNKQTRIMGASGPGTINKAVDIAIAPEGTKYVIDPSQSAILVFNADERYLGTFRLPNSSPVVRRSGKTFFTSSISRAAHVKVLESLDPAQILRTFRGRKGGGGRAVHSARSRSAVESAGWEHLRCLRPDPAPGCRSARLKASSCSALAAARLTRPGDPDYGSKQLGRSGTGGDGRVRRSVDAAFKLRLQVLRSRWAKVEGFYGAAGIWHSGQLGPPRRHRRATKGTWPCFAKYLHPADSRRSD